MIDGIIKAGITPQVNVIVGIPEYTKQELIENFKVVYDCYVKGCDVGVNRYLLALPGAPIYSSGQYKTIDKTWTHPITGKVFSIPDQFVPMDDEVREVVEQMEPLHERLLQEVIEKNSWENKIVPRRVLNVISLLSAVKILGDEELTKRFQEVLDETIYRCNKSDETSENSLVGKNNTSNQKYDYALAYAQEF